MVQPPTVSIAVKNTNVGLWLVTSVLLMAGCQSSAPPVPIDIVLDWPVGAPYVDSQDAKVVRGARRDHENGFLLLLHLPAKLPQAAREKTFHLDEVALYAGVEGIWFRDRFGLKLTAKGYWQDNRDDEAYFVADRFVTYPHGIEFRPNDPKAKAWLQEQVRGLWHEVLQQVRNAR